MNKIQCPPEFANPNPENTSCANCGSRIHYTLFDGYIRCSYCDTIIDDKYYYMDTDKQMDGSK